MRRLLMGVVLIAIMVVILPARGAGLQVGDEKTFLKFGGLLQTWADFNEKKAPDGEAWETEMYLRRIRLLFSGQLNEKVNFFIDTDSSNFGKANDYAVRMFIQDAWMELNLCEAFQLDVGMLLVPFSHHGMQGAVSLNSIDYHSALMKYPSGAHFVWRDYGLMARGMLLGTMLEYRLGVFNGVHGLANTTDAAQQDPRNPHEWPRVAARLTFNAFDTEGGAGAGGFFYDGLYLKKTDVGIESAKKILSLGLSFDWQHDLNVSWRDATYQAIETRDDYWAFAGDIFVDMPLSEDKLLGLSGQVNFYYYNHGDRRSGTGYPFYGAAYATGLKWGTVEYTGMGIASELSLRYDAFAALLNLDWFNSSKADGDKGDYLAVYGGLNYWYAGHNASVKLQAGGSKKDGAAEFALFGQIQAQLLF